MAKMVMGGLLPLAIGAEKVLKAEEDKDGGKLIDHERLHPGNIRLTEAIPTVALHHEGKFKYIQIRLQPINPTVGVGPVTIIRGYDDCMYHSDIFLKFVDEELGQYDDLKNVWKSDCPGGGRIYKNNML